MTIMVIGMKVEAVATKSSINMISASPAVLPYPTTTPSDSTSSASPTISSFFPKANSPSGQAESPYGPSVMAYGPAPSSGEIIGRATSSTSHSASAGWHFRGGVEPWSFWPGWGVRGGWPGWLECSGRLGIVEGVREDVVARVGELLREVKGGLELVVTVCGAVEMEGGNGDWAVVRTGFVDWYIWKMQDKIREGDQMGDSAKGKLKTAQKYPSSRIKGKEIVRYKKWKACEDLVNEETVVEKEVGNEQEGYFIDSDDGSDVELSDEDRKIRKMMICLQQM
uniref:Uncharacterized protein n=1 Tax=Chenopodium quinoa TaxID=63459 RepID=A0A803MZJ6_CHEQI